MKVFPVVHLGETSMDSSIYQAHIAHDLGADGIYLIDHYNASRDTGPLFDTLEGIREADPDRYVGLNILGLDVPSAFGRVATALTSGRLHETPNDIWVDDVRSGTTTGFNLEGAFDFRKSLKEVADVTLHGGIAFKYTATATNKTDKALKETMELQKYVDVITTSGMGTGQPPTVEKLEAMKSVAGEKPIAVASGIDLSNIEIFAETVEEVLVASSVETEPGSGVFNRKELAEFIRIAHSLAR